MSKHGHKDDVHLTPDVSHISNQNVAHETSDVNIGAIAKFVIGLGILCAFTAVLMWWMYGVLERQEDAKYPAPGPMAMKTREEKLPPEPRLQSAPGFEVRKTTGEIINLEMSQPETEYKEIQREWDDFVAHGRKDPKTGQVISIPIEDAKKAVLGENSLVARPQDATTSQLGIARPTYSSSGRMTERIVMSSVPQSPRGSSESEKPKH